MCTSNLRRLVLATAVLAGGWLSSPNPARSQDALLQRPATVAATMVNSKTYGGQYAGAGKARICGETDPMQSFSGERAFLMEYPLDYDGTEIVDVRFHSKALVGDVERTGNFFVSITVKSDAGGAPPAYVVDTERPAPSHSGVATLEKIGGTERIKLEAVNEMGETLTMIFECAPRE